MRRRYLLWIIIFSTIGLVYLLTQPKWIFKAAARIYPGALYGIEETSLPRDAPAIALTIDDGPGPHTSDIIGLLNRYGAKATFFNISEHIPGHESVVASAVASGHELGNHLTQDKPSILLSEKDFEVDLRTAESVLLPFLYADANNNADEGAMLRWLRPGGGIYSSKMVAIAQKNGYQIALGNNFPYDTHIPSARFSASFVLNRLKPGDIVVLHDGQGENAQRSDRTLEALETILPALRIRGYKVTTLSELVDTAKPSDETAAQTNN